MYEKMIVVLHRIRVVIGQRIVEDNRIRKIHRAVEKRREVLSKALSVKFVGLDGGDNRHVRDVSGWAPEKIAEELMRVNAVREQYMRVDALLAIWTEKKSKATSSVYAATDAYEKVVRDETQKLVSYRLEP